MTKKLLILMLLILPFLGISQLTDQNKDFLRIELAYRINELRISKGLKPLIFNDTLRKAAAFHSRYMAENDILSHDEKKSKYATPKNRVLAFDGKDFEIVGENALYSKPQEFPLKKKDLIALADEMFTSWKNSPGHYANMTEPEYVYGDLGFETNSKKQIVYATQVFGTKGYVVKNQISQNIFGLTKATIDCEKEFESYSNLVLNMGNDLSIEGNEVILYYHNIEHFKEILSNPNDGIAIDLVSKNQMQCGIPNQLDFSPIFDGILLKPIFSNELLANNRAEGDFRIITKVADIPENLDGNDYSLSLIIIKNNKACKYVFPAYVPRQAYSLRPIEPIIKDEPLVVLMKEGITHSQIINYDFNTNQTSAIKNINIEKYNSKIHSIHINSFSSVEGDSVHNAYLHNSRANFIKRNLISELKVQEPQFSIDAKENWSLMHFQLNYFEQDELALLSHDSLKKLLSNRDQSLPWDSLLFSQRKAVAIINYSGIYDEQSAIESFGEFNLRTAVATNNPSLANKAMYAMHEHLDFFPSILFEPQIVEFINNQPSTVGNYAALLSYQFYSDPYATTRFIHNWLNRENDLSEDARTNILHLYTLVGDYLLDNWDVSSERLSNVIHPLKVEKIIPEKLKDELLLNLHLTFIQYFGQINDGVNISKSFYFIADYFKNQTLKPEDDVDLTLFFNNWSMYNMTVEYLLSKFKNDKLNEDGVFVLAETMNFTNYKDESGVYIEVQKKALSRNKKRWCDWLNGDFQVLRNIEIKRLYCESCK